VILDIRADDPAVLKDPEPWTLVDNLGGSAIELKVYFWVDSSQNSWIKVKSTIIHTVVKAFRTSGISIPYATREVIFPEGLPIHWRDSKESDPSDEEHPGLDKP